MWDLPGPGLQPVSPALAGGFLTTVPRGKPPYFLDMYQNICGWNHLICFKMVWEEEVSVAIDEARLTMSWWLFVGSGLWVHGGASYYSVYFCICSKFSITKSKNKKWGGLLRFRVGGRSQASARRYCSGKALREWGFWVCEAPVFHRRWSVKLCQALRVPRWLRLSPYPPGQRPVSMEGPGSGQARPEPSRRALKGLWSLNKGNRSSCHYSGSAGRPSGKRRHQAETNQCARNREAWGWSSKNVIIQAPNQIFAGIVGNWPSL